MITKYLKFVLNDMRRGGFVILGMLIFSVLPYTILQIYEHYTISVLWFIFSTVIVASFGAFYFTQNNKNS